VIRRSKPMKRSGRIAPKSRTAGEYNRIYGSKARVRWVKLQSCVSCGTEGTEDRPNHNHHTQNGGLSRKADHTTIVSLCPSCHHEHHTGVLRGTREWWAEQARLTELRWQRYTQQEAA
jgi:hypothetical protein